MISDTEKVFELTVIGGGIGGAPCALRSSQYNINTAWILGDKKTAKRSRSQWVMNVDNMIGVHPDIVLSGLRRQWRKQPKLITALDETSHLHIGTRDIITNVRERLKEIPGVIIEIRAVDTVDRRIRKRKRAQILAANE